MRSIKNARQSTNQNFFGLGNISQRRRMILAATGMLALAGSAFGQATNLYFTADGTTLGGTGLWDGTDVNNIPNTWSTSSTTVAGGAWGSGDIANFSGASNVSLTGSDTASGLVFTGGATTITVSGNGPWALNVGSGTVAGGNPFTISQSFAGRQILAAPIVGSADITITSNQTNGSNTVDLAGNMSQFTGNIYFNETGTTNGAQFQLDTPIGGAGTLYLDSGVNLTTNNQLGNDGTNGVLTTQFPGTIGDNSTGTLLQTTPNIYTISNNMVLNYKGVAKPNASTIGVANGPSYMINSVLTHFSKIVSYSGAISSVGATPGLIIGGTRGTTILANSNNTYAGNTTVGVGNNNGMLQFGVPNAIPATSQLIIGSGSSSIGPTDLDGNDQTIAGLSTGTSATGATTVGNIYNLTVNNPNFPVQNDPNHPGYTQNLSANSATITITPTAALSTTYKGDIGDTNLAINPLNDNQPYSNGISGANNVQYVTANTNISLVLNGASNGGASTLTLAPVSGLPSGNEYTGMTTVNNNATLVFGRGGNSDTNATYTGGPGVGAPPGYYTLNGGGDVDINAGAKLTSVATNATHFAGGASGTINLNAGTDSLPGAQLLPGGAGTIGTLSTNNINFISGASMTFDIASPASFDYIFVNGTLSLDSSGPDHTININVPSGDTLIPGTYTLISGFNDIATDGTNGFVLGTTTGLTGTALNDTFNLVNNGANLQLQVLAPALRWDPTGQAANNSGVVTEGSGEWTDGSGPDGNPASPFYFLLDGTEQSWSNTTTNAVIIGGDSTQNGGVITLGNNIVVNGLLTFGPIAASQNYSIAGNGFTLTLGGGINVNNTAATSTTPSAEIDAPVVLSASQTWEVDPGQFLDVTGSVTESDATPSFTLTKTGSGTLDLANTTGSIGALNVMGGTVLLGSANTIGNAGVTLNGGALELTGTATFGNMLTIGASGGAIGTTTGTLTIPEAVTTTNNFEVIGSGATILQGNNTANVFQNGEVTGGTTMLTGTNTFTSISLTGGTLIVTNTAELSAAPITLNGGGLDISQIDPTSNTYMTTLPNVLTGSGSGGKSVGDTLTFTNTAPFTLGPIAGTGDIHFVAAGTGSTPELIVNNDNINTTVTPNVNYRPGGGALYFDTPNLTVVFNNTTTSDAPSIGVSTLAFTQNTTLDVEAASVTTGAIRGDNSSPNSASNVVITKIGPGTLMAGGSAGTANVAGSSIVINDGNVELITATGLGGGGGSTPALNIVLNTNASPGTTNELIADYGGTRSGGSLTLNANTEVVRANGISGNETNFVADSAADVVTIAGNATISNANIQGSDGETQNTSGTFSFNNPVVVNPGVTLTLENDNPQYDPENPGIGGFAGNNLLGFRGPTAATNTYDTITISAGATIVQTGPGELRLGRGNSQGIALIGQGSSGSESLFQPGPDAYMTDNNTNTGEINTIFVVNGTGNAGLRIEAPMNATYLDPTSPDANSAATQGTTGLLGVNTTASAVGPVPTGFSVIGNAFTVMSPNRLAALSTPYNNGTTTITPSGTLTLAANDAGSVTGLINGGPAAAPGSVVNSVTQGSVALALDNTAGSSGTHIYVIDPGANNQTFANFAGLTVERTYPAGAAVVAQLQLNSGSTKIPSLTITGGAKLDITNQSLAVDPGPTGTPALSTIAGYLVAGYDHGQWDGAGGIGSSAISALPGTSIGYALNSNLPPSEQFTVFGGQDVSLNAVLVKYTWDGDLNLDGVVDSNDLALMNDGNPGWIGGDLNYDGKVNADDWGLFMLGSAEQTGQLTSAVPEPSALGLLAGAGLLIRRRRRA